MRRLATQLRAPALISAFLVLPFVSLEAINRGRFEEGFPFPVFATLWLLGTAFILTLTPLWRTWQTRDTARLHSVPLVLRIAFLILVAWLWISIVLDQMPCFRGVPNCD